MAKITAVSAVDGKTQRAGPGSGHLKELQSRPWNTIAFVNYGSLDFRWKTSRGICFPFSVLAPPRITIRDHFGVNYGLFSSLIIPGPLGLAAFFLLPTSDPPSHSFLALTFESTEAEIKRRDSCQFITPLVGGAGLRFTGKGDWTDGPHYLRQGRVGPALPFSMTSQFRGKTSFPSSLS